MTDREMWDLDLRPEQDRPVFFPILVIDIYLTISGQILLRHNIGMSIFG